MEQLSPTQTYDTIVKDPADFEDYAAGGASHNKAGFERGEVINIDAEGENRWRPRWKKHFGIQRKRQSSSQEQPQYRVYKRRWIGLWQLVLLNIVISWDVSRTISSFYCRSIYENMTIISSFHTAGHGLSLQILRLLVGRHEAAVKNPHVQARWI